MNTQIAIIGLGYVGLPLAKLFSQNYSVVGFDTDNKRITQLRNGIDTTGEITKEALLSVNKISDDGNPGLYLSCNDLDLKNKDFYIITVPTPIDRDNLPNLNPLLLATKTVAKHLVKGATIIYESTVYPGATEEECVPVLEQISGLQFNIDFFVGYSPERINPGDKQHNIGTIIKVTAGSTSECATNVDNLYKSVIAAGTYPVSSIKVAEAAKVIENTQRDLNIAFVNELAKIFSKMDINTNEVIEAAATKWNFQKFNPGLVGGHCIGVDPYYLSYKAQKIGYQPEIILAGRKVNESMGKYIASRVIKLMIRKKMHVMDSQVLILGATFKENCADIRNSKVIDIIRHLESYGTVVTVYDPHANAKDLIREYNLTIEENPFEKKYDSVILAVAHEDFADLNVSQFLKVTNVIYDVKGFLKSPVDETL